MDRKKYFRDNNLIGGNSMDNKYYQELLIEIISMAEDVVTASTGGDPFDDSYQDFGEN